MDTVIETAHRLVAELEASEPYTRYVACYDAIKDNFECIFKIKEYKRLQFEFLAKESQGNPPNYDEEKILSKLYSDLLLDEKTNAFFESEKALLKLLNEVYAIIGNSFKLDLLLK